MIKTADRASSVLNRLRSSWTGGRGGRPANRILAEPLVHFLLIGLTLFGLSQWRVARAEDPNEIVVDARAYSELVETFAAERGRVPSEREMATLVNRWIINETLYREAQSLGLTEGDEMIRERIMQKMRVLIQNAVVVEPPDEATARRWFAAERDRYDTPPRLSFQLARVDGAEAEARDVARRMNAQDHAPSTASPRIYPFQDRPRPTLVEVFGEDFLTQIEAAPRDVWTAVATPGGWQVARLTEVAPEAAAEFSEIAGTVRADWVAEEARRVETEAVEALIAGYDVAVEPYDPQAFETEARLAADASASVGGER